MDVNIKTANGSVISKLEIIGNAVDFSTKAMTIVLGAYDAGNNKVQQFEYQYQLTDFPVPSLDDQWKIVQPLIDQINAGTAGT